MLNVVQESQASKRSQLQNVDRALKSALESRTLANPDFWTFSKGATRTGTHAYFRYPAMMVPAVQRELISTVIGLQPVSSILDPFAGSGTILTEAMLFGLDSRVQDINPLAILLCKTKSDKYSASELQDWAKHVVARAKADRKRKLDIDFPGIEKWFRPCARAELATIRRAILSIPIRAVRRFFWVAMAETIRQTSNSRTSTYKLHIRPAEEIAGLPKPTPVFVKVVSENIARHSDFLGQISCDHDTCHRVFFRDTRSPFDEQFDLIVTSPPYGDNTSTVPYGQSAFLALQWIALEDISSAIPADILRTTSEIDRRSLGGNRSKSQLDVRYGDIIEKSSSLRDTTRYLSDFPRDRAARVLSFVSDLDSTLDPIVSAARENAYIILTVGNRKVGNKDVRLDAIIMELMNSRPVSFVLHLDRRIPNKRMAVRNGIASTMRNERILVFRKDR